MLKACLIIIFIFEPFLSLQKSLPELESRKTNQFSKFYRIPYRQLTPSSLELDENGMKVLNGDEISYLLSDLSMYDLNTLSQLIDVMNEQGIEIENDIKDRVSFDEHTRSKRKTRSDVITGENENNPVASVNQKYIQQLDESFPNVDLLNQDDKEKQHIRVKRD